MDRNRQTITRRVIALALFVDGRDVLMLHQMTGPEPDCWDLPGGGVELGESLEQGLRREVLEETGISEFQIHRMLTIAERFYPTATGQQHTLNIIYRCSLSVRPTQLISQDPQEVGLKGIQWLAISELKPEICSSRSWEALQAAGRV